MQASIHLIRDARALARARSRAMFAFYGLNPEFFENEIEKAQQVSPLGFRIQNLSILYCSNGSHPG